MAAVSALLLFRYRLNPAGLVLGGAVAGALVLWLRSSAH
jgi:hypothetical protein